MAIRLSVISTHATYNIIAERLAVDEGQAVVFTLQTTGVQIGQAVPYTITGTATSADFTNGTSFEGVFTVDASGMASVLVGTVLDAVYDPGENFTLTLTDVPTISTTVDINNIVPGTVWDSGLTIWDSGSTNWDYQ